MKACLNSLRWALAVTTTIFTFVPEGLFTYFPWNVYGLLVNFESINHYALYMATLINRGSCFIAIWLLWYLAYRIYLSCRKHVTIKNRHYIIRVEYGDVMKKKECKRVINFDECYTTTVGERPEDINRVSLCGKYLLANPKLDINHLIKMAKVKPSEGKSRFQQQTRYEPGTIVPNGDDLLLAFAPLDADGRGRFPSLKEYKECLVTMWDELDKYYGQNDVCIPVLGSGVTRFGEDSDNSPTQQELLDMIIWSYKLSSNKIKPPYKLRIICQKRNDFSLDHIDG